MIEDFNYTFSCKQYTEGLKKESNIVDIKILILFFAFNLLFCLWLRIFFLTIIAVFWNISIRLVNNLFSLWLFFISRLIRRIFQNNYTILISLKMIYKIKRIIIIIFLIKIYWFSPCNKIVIISFRSFRTFPDYNQVFNFIRVIFMNHITFFILKISQTN